MCLTNSIIFSDCVPNELSPAIIDAFSKQI